MTKRKRVEPDQISTEDRHHEKFRIQEVEHPADGNTHHTSVPNGPLVKKSSAESKTEAKARKLQRRQQRAQERARTERLQVINGPHEQDVDHPAPTPKDDLDTGRGLVPDVLFRAQDDVWSKELDIPDSKSRGTLSARHKWKVSKPVGGQMIGVDASFDIEEQYIVIAYGTFVGVYSTSSSLLVRRLQVSDESIVSDFAMDTQNNDHLYITTMSGDIQHWDWKQGHQLSSWQSIPEIHYLGVASEPKGIKDNQVLYTTEKLKSGGWQISAGRLNNDSTIPERKTLLTFEHPLSKLQILGDGKVIVVASRQQLIIGSSVGSATGRLDDLQYVWRVIDCPDWITSFDARVRPSGRTSHKKHGSSLLEALDIATGSLRGVIHTYDDILHKLIQREKTAKSSKVDEVHSRRLHWHRTAVSSIKWSLDGNYIISGGRETVLVLWQLETGHRQDLPHLGAAIESIVVSPSGSSYALRLADNSAMILSTAELQPTFSIAGSQLPSLCHDSSTLPFLPTVDTYDNERPLLRSHLRAPACVTSQGTDKLLLAIPSSITRHPGALSHNASYLQTCDIRSGHQLNRQALTRTNITTLIMGPEANTIEEPNVTFMQVDTKGQWLATIDEWSPPKRDVEPLAYDSESVSREQSVRLETYLKFWMWQEDDQVWELVFRIDNPHASETGDIYQSCRVLGLASDPHKSGFSTVGEDGTVRMWQPTARRRRELAVKGSSGQDLVSWYCRHRLSLGSDPDLGAGHNTAKLAFSADGSILAVSLSPTTINLIDTHAGVIRVTYTGLAGGPIYGLGIIDKYLIILSHELVIFDLINEEIHFGLDLQLHELSPEKAARSLLAVDHRHNTFAIAIKDPESSQLRTKLAIFAPATPEPLAITKIASVVTNLLPAINKKGYYSIDANAEIRSISPKQSVPTGPPIAPREEPLPARRGLDAILGRSKKALEEGRGAEKLLTARPGQPTADTTNGARKDRVFVSLDKLADIFESGPTMPPMEDMFHKVAMLCNGRTDSS